MSRTFHHGERRIRVRGVRRRELDVKRLARALIDLAQAQAEAEAEAEAEHDRLKAAERRAKKQRPPTRPERDAA